MHPPVANTYELENLLIDPIKRHDDWWWMSDDKILWCHSRLNNVLVVKISFISLQKWSGSYFSENVIRNGFSVGSIREVLQNPDSDIHNEPFCFSAHGQLLRKDAKWFSLEGFCKILLFSLVIHRGTPHIENHRNIKSWMTGISHS